MSFPYNIEKTYSDQYGNAVTVKFVNDICFLSGYYTFNDPQGSSSSKEFNIHRVSSLQDPVPYYQGWIIDAVYYSNPPRYGSSRCYVEFTPDYSAIRRFIHDYKPSGPSGNDEIITDLIGSSYS